MIRYLLIAAMTMTTLVSLAPGAAAWTCVSTLDGVCEPVLAVTGAVYDEAGYQTDCVAEDDGLYPTADCSLHGRLPGVLVCSPSPWDDIVC